MSRNVPRSGLRDIAWPALPDELGARMLALQFQFEASERWPEAEIEAQQFRQIEELLAFCHTAVPFWRDRLRKAGIRPGLKLTRQIWSRLPILTRRDAQDAGLRLRAAKLPDGHGQIVTGATSGSTGVPLSYARSELARFMLLSANLRLVLWHGLDMTGKTAIARLLASGADVPQTATIKPNWGEGFEAFSTGPSILFDLRLPPSRQFDILAQEGVADFVTFPSNAAQIARYCRDTGRMLPDLRAINTYGELLTDDARALCREVFGVPIIDAYSAEETGFLSIQCPHHDHHHVMAEHVKVEVLDAAGHPCGPGQTGRVVVTPLHNFAMPLLRYEIGDYAEVGPPCTCGRTLPVLTRILGRSRDRVHLPNGDSKLAFLGAQQLYRIPAIIQHQVAQIAPEIMEYRLVTRDRLTEADETFLTTILRSSLAYPFQVRFTYVDAIPRMPNGKYQDFISELG